MGEIPPHGGGEVAGIGVEALDPHAVTGATQRSIGLLGQDPEVLRVSAFNIGEIAAGDQPFGDDLANGLE